MKKKTLKLLAVLLVVCLAVTALAVFAGSADCYLKKSMYNVKSGYAYGSYASGYLNTYSTSSCTVKANLYGEGGYLTGSTTASPGTVGVIGAQSGHSSWYIYLQPAVSGGSGLGGEAYGRVNTSNTAR